MTKEEFFNFQEKFYADNMEITKRKNADYTGVNGSPFANFQQVEHLGCCSTEQGFMVRMSDKMSRIASFVAKGELLVKDESVTDTIKDLANYCSLLAGYIESQKKGDRQGELFLINGDCPNTNG
jgi:hypothetical protein